MKLKLSSLQKQVNNMEPQYEQKLYRQIARKHSEQAISEDTLKDAFHQLKVEKKMASEDISCLQEVEEIIDNADENDDNIIDSREFTIMMGKMQKVENPKARQFGLDFVETTAYAEECYYWPPPWFILSLSVVQFIIFFVFDAMQNHQFNPECSYLVYSPFRKLEVWRFITYCFIHINLKHLLLNMGLQIMVGITLEMSHGTWRVALSKF